MTSKVRGGKVTCVIVFVLRRATALIAAFVMLGAHAHRKGPCGKHYKAKWSICSLGE